MGDRIVSGRDVARRDGAPNLTVWVQQRSGELVRRNRLETGFSGKVLTDGAVQARVDFGRWIADCPDCGGAEYVDPEEPVFFCLSCGNRSVKGDGRPVVFPEPNERDEIERLLLERPVDDRRGGTAVDRALLAKPIYVGLARSWNPHEGVEDLREQNRKAVEDFMEQNRTAEV